jgi:hypothetical protein
MGRYYNGDIDGKFWFGVQSSNDADFFGSTGCEPNYLEYSFSKEEHYEEVCEGVTTCITELGENKEKLDTFFATHEFYNDGELAKETGILDSEVSDRLMWYARLRLGEKIKKCLEEQDYCDFQAEL